MTTSRVRALLACGAVAGVLLAGTAVPANGAPAQPVFSISANSGAPGVQITVSGDQCAVGEYAHVFVYQGVVGVPVGGRPATDLLLTLTHNPINPAAWSTQLTIPLEAQPDTLTLIANCAPASTPEADTPRFWYSQALAFTVTGVPGSTTTTTADPGTTTTTVGNTTTTAPAVASNAVAATPTFTG
jgi:hypothetical protein